MGGAPYRFRLVRRCLAARFFFFPDKSITRTRIFLDKIIPIGNSTTILCQITKGKDLTFVIN